METQEIINFCKTNIFMLQDELNDQFIKGNINSDDDVVSHIYGKVEAYNNVIKYLNNLKKNGLT